MQTRPGWWTGWLALAATLGHAQPDAEIEFASCVRGSAPLRVPAATARATLDDADRVRFHDAAQARYPLYQRGGFAPAQVLMLQRDGRWIYVTVAKGWQARPCFTAVFAAERFDFTPSWLDKYRPGPPLPGD